MRRKTVMAYLNTVPLAAAPRFGEVNGIGDGLWAWYGLDFAAINKTLSEKPGTRDDCLCQRAQTCAVADRGRTPSVVLPRRQPQGARCQHRRPSRPAGQCRRDSARTGRPGQAGQTAQHQTSASIRRAPRFVDQKATNAQRIRVAQLLGEKRLYDLDRLDLQVNTTINQPAQKIISELSAKPGQTRRRARIGAGRTSPAASPRIRWPR